MASTAELYQEKLMEILEDHSGFFQKPPADFTQDTYNKLFEGVYLKTHADEVQDDITKTLGDFGKTDRKGFLQTALDKLASGFGTNSEKMAGMFLPEGTVPNEVTATSATVNPSEMGGGLGGHTNTDNLFGYLTKDLDPVVVETAMQDSAGTGLLDGNPEMWT